VSGWESGVRVACQKNGGGGGGEQNGNERMLEILKSEKGKW